MALSWLELGLICVLLTFPIMWKRSHKLRYYSKTTFYYTYMMFTGFVIVPYAMWRPKDPKNIVFVRDLWNATLNVFQWKTIVRNREYVDVNHPVVIVSNHQSSLDMIALMATMPERTTVLAKKELKYAGAWGLAAVLCGLLFVDRSNPERARSTMAQAVDYLKEKCMKCWVFVEGTRRLDGKIHEFKKGAFHLAIQAQIPVVPVVISSYSPFLNDKKKIFEPGKVIITCLPPVNTEGLTKDDINALIEKVRTPMVEVFESSSKEVADELQGSSLSNGTS